MVSSASLTNVELNKPTSNGLLTNPSNGLTNSHTRGNSNSHITLNRNNTKRNSFNSTTQTNLKYQDSINLNHSNRFSISVSNNPSEFYFRNLLHYVRSGSIDNYNEKLKFIRDQCPQLPPSKSNTATTSSSNLFQQHGHHHLHNLRLTERSRSALIALLILIVENYHTRNKTQQLQQTLNQEIVNYLLVILENLPHCKWQDDQTFVTNTTKNRMKFLYLS